MQLRSIPIKRKIRTSQTCLHFKADYKKVFNSHFHYVTTCVCWTSEGILSEFFILMMTAINTHPLLSIGFETLPAIPIIFLFEHRCWSFMHHGLERHIYNVAKLWTMPFISFYSPLYCTDYNINYFVLYIILFPSPVNTEEQVLLIKLDTQTPLHLFGMSRKALWFVLFSSTPAFLPACSWVVPVCLCTLPRRTGILVSLQLPRNHLQNVHRRHNVTSSSEKYIRWVLDDTKGSFSMFLNKTYVVGTH